MQAPEDAIDQRTMLTPRTPHFALVRRQFWLYQPVLLFRQFVPPHHSPLRYGKVVSIPQPEADCQKEPTLPCHRASRRGLRKCTLLDVSETFVFRKREANPL